MLQFPWTILPETSELLSSTSSEKLHPFFSPHSEFPHCSTQFPDRWYGSLSQSLSTVVSFFHQSFQVLPPLIKRYKLPLHSLIDNPRYFVEFTDNTLNWFTLFLSDRQLFVTSANFYLLFIVLQLWSSSRFYTGSYFFSLSTCSHLVTIRRHECTLVFPSYSAFRVWWALQSTYHNHTITIL